MTSGSASQAIRSDSVSVRSPSSFAVQN
jgi:hypothetical protein